MKTNTERKEHLPQEEWETYKVQRLRKKLAEKAKREPKFRFYSLYGHIHRMDVLKEAWKQVKCNGGCPGIDNVSINSFDTEEKIDHFLSGIRGLQFLLLFQVEQCVILLVKTAAAVFQCSASFKYIIFRLYDRLQYSHRRRPSRVQFHPR